MVEGTDQKPKMGLSFGAWLATAGGTRCPMCGKFAKPSDLGFIGGSGPNIHVTAYGHLPGKGCNRAPAKEPDNVQP